MTSYIAANDGPAFVAALSVDAQQALAIPADISAATDSPFGGAAIKDGELRTIAGREDVNQISYADQVAGVSKNSVGDNSLTGNAQISDNAFQNMSGLSILNVNTGNNVAINASMNVNISFTAAP